MAGAADSSTGSRTRCCSAWSGPRPSLAWTRISWSGFDSGLRSRHGLILVRIGLTGVAARYVTKGYNNYTGPCPRDEAVCAVQSRILVPGRRKGRGVQCGLVWLSGLTATASTVFVARLSPTIFVSCSQARRRRKQLKQRMMGSTCSAALKIKPLSQVRLPSPLRPCSVLRSANCQF